MAISALGPISGGLSPEPLYPPPTAAPEGAFTRVLTQYLGQASAQQAAATQAAIDLAMGKTEEVHQVMLEVAKADLAFRTVLEVRNRLTEAYQEIMRMQV